MIGAYQEAQSYLQRALAISEQELGATHPTTQAVRENYTVLLQIVERKKKRGNWKRLFAPFSR